MGTKKQTNTPPAREKHATPAGVDAGGAATHLHITARSDGFRRCGRAWPACGVIVPMSDFSADDLDRLRAEPALVVVDVVA